MYRDRSICYINVSHIYKATHASNRVVHLLIITTFCIKLRNSKVVSTFFL